MRFVLIYSLLFVCGIGALVAQSPEQNLQKYNRYRQRLQGDSIQPGFVRVGSFPGGSLPMGGRIPDTDCETNWHMLKYGCTTRKGKGMIEWGDGTIHLAMYIALLATEYKNLQLADQSTDSIAKELWLALDAFDRLDYRAETFLGLPPDLNGFFLRDDVPDDFHLRFDTSTYHCTRSNGSCGEADPREAHFVSQDQVLVLFMGWLLVSELVPNERYLDSLPTFGEKAAAQVDRVVSYFRKNNWSIVAPNGIKVPNRWGGDVQALSYGVAEGANRIAKPYTQKNYQTRLSKGLGLSIFNTFSYSFSLQRRNLGMVVQSAVLVNSWSPKVMDTYCKKADVVVWAILDAVANKRKLSKVLSRSDFEKILDTAPPDGPCFNTPDCSNTPGWMGFDRWIHPELQNGNPWGRFFEYNGLDYMLLYNLYHLYFREELGAYQRF